MRHIIRTIFIFVLLVVTPVVSWAAFDFASFKQEIACQQALGEGRPLIIAGLGNVGYDNTRHNAGYDTLRNWANNQGARSFQSYEHWTSGEFETEALAIEYTDYSGASSPRRNGNTVEWRVGGEIFTLPKDHPLNKLGPTYIAFPYYDINESGDFIGALATSLGLHASEIVVLVDDLQLNRMQLAMGRGRLAPLDDSILNKTKDQYSDGHNGIKSINVALGKADYWRLRIGVSSPRAEKMEQSLPDWVLDPNYPEDIERMQSPQFMSYLSEVFMNLKKWQLTNSDSAKGLIVGEINRLTKLNSKKQTTSGL